MIPEYSREILKLRMNANLTREDVVKKLRGMSVAKLLRIENPSSGYYIPDEERLSEVGKAVGASDKQIAAWIKEARFVRKLGHENVRLGHMLLEERTKGLILAVLESTNIDPLVVGYALALANSRMKDRVFTLESSKVLLEELQSARSLWDYLL